MGLKKAKSASSLSFTAAMVEFLRLPNHQLTPHNVESHPESGKGVDFFGGLDSSGGMIRGGFLSEEYRKALIALARDNLSAGRVTRRANALVLWTMA